MESTRSTIDEIERLAAERLEPEEEVAEFISLVRAASDSGAELDRLIEGIKEEAISGDG
jgi:hypothetical protein